MRFMYEMGKSKYEKDDIVENYFTHGVGSTALLKRRRMNQVFTFFIELE